MTAAPSCGTDVWWTRHERQFQVRIHIRRSLQRPFNGISSHGRCAIHSRPL